MVLCAHVLDRFETYLVVYEVSKEVCPDHQQHDVPQSGDVLVSNKCPSPYCGNTPPKYHTLHQFPTTFLELPFTKNACKEAHQSLTQDLAELSNISNNCTDVTTSLLPVAVSPSVPNKYTIMRGVGYIELHTSTIFAESSP